MIETGKRRDLRSGVDLADPGTTVLVTGGAGFIGSAVVRKLIRDTRARVVNVDKLAYSGRIESVGEAREHPRHRFVRTDICDRARLRHVFDAHAPDVVLHLAAESHVDRSIDGPAAFIQTNVHGTFTVLEECRRHWLRLPPGRRDRFRLVHISTDEVFGSLGASGRFSETTPYAPNSPYAASKAAADHLARAWHHTYGLPVIITNSSNNYGPYQFPEKLIPLMILKALAGEPLPVYGSGENVRDWLYVEDHAEALLLAAERGLPGESYNVGGSSERRNLDVVEAICDALDEIAPDPGIGDRSALVTFVEDRPGHDLRYAIDSSKIRGELGWSPRESFATGLRKTVEWYLANRSWWAPVCARTYHGERLGRAVAT